MEPFRLSPDRRFCIHHPSFARAKAYMRYALHRQEGFVVITGRPGTGKTTLIDELTHEFGEAGHQVARLESARLEADDLLRMVCYAFDIPPEGASKSELLRRFSNYIGRSFKSNRRPLLIVDEAQGLSHGALEELRLLTNQLLNGQPMLQIFLVGQEELRDLLAEPSLEQLRQRVVAACHIEPLKPDQTSDYVLHRLRMAGWDGNPRFESALFPLLYRFTQGTPRIINQVCSRLLLHGSLEQRATLGVEDTELVINELRSEHLAMRESNSIIDLEAFANESLAALSRPDESPAVQPQPIGERLMQASPPLDAPVEKVVQEVEAVLQQGVAAKKKATEHQPKASETADAPSGKVAVELLLDDAPITLRLRRDTAPLWGIAATVALGLSLTGLTLLSAPIHELEQLAPVSTWEKLRVIRARDMVSRWTGGSWPLCESTCAPVVDEPAAVPVTAKAPIKSIARMERVVPMQAPEQVTDVEPAQVPEQASLMESAKMPERHEQKQTPGIEEPREPAGMVKALVETQISVVEADAPVEEPREQVSITMIEEEPLLQVTVSQVSFGFDSAGIQPEYTRLLDRVADILKSSADSSAHIIGYTDSIGDISYNEWLSRRRAKAVAAYIMDKGVSEQRLQVEGRGLEPSEGGNPPVSKAGRTVKIFLKQGMAARLASADHGT
jgi:type II secretory pathway predicted ATPase ExeA/outer membrane protein OmpA-like peptidoglycan-associated protein